MADATLDPRVIEELESAKRKLLATDGRYSDIREVTVRGKNIDQAVIVRMVGDESNDNKIPFWEFRKKGDTEWKNHYPLYNNLGDTMSLSPLTFGTGGTGEVKIEIRAVVRPPREYRSFVINAELIAEYDSPSSQIVDTCILKIPISRAPRETAYA